MAPVLAPVAVLDSIRHRKPVYVAPKAAVATPQDTTQVPQDQFTTGSSHVAYEAKTALARKAPNAPNTPRGRFEQLLSFARAPQKAVRGVIAGALGLLAAPGCSIEVGALTNADDVEATANRPLRTGPDAATICEALLQRFEDRRSSGAISIGGERIREMSSDFGRRVRSAPQVVVDVSNTKDVQDVLQVANALGVKVTPRGNGGTTEGQAVSTTIALVTRNLDTFQINSEDGKHSVTVGSGLTWDTIADRVRRKGNRRDFPRLQVPVITGYKHLTVGGTVGGAGGGGYRSHTRGLQVDHVEELEVVTGNGDIVTASPTQNSELFYSVLGGNGQVGVITKAKVPLVPDELEEGKKLASYELTYTDRLAFLEDLLADDLTEHWYEVQGNIKPTKDGGWTYIIKGSVDRNEVSRRDMKARYGAADVDRKPHTLFRAGRHAELESAVYNFGLKLVGRWDTPHPWATTYLPLDKTADFVAEQIDQVDRDGLGKLGFISLNPTANKQTPFTYLQLPDGERFGSYGIFYMPPDDGTAPALWEQLERMQDAANAVGGKSYLSDTVPQTAQEWESYFGDGAEAIWRIKHEYDPNLVLGEVNEGQARFWERRP